MRKTNILNLIIACAFITAFVACNKKETKPEEPTAPVVPIPVTTEMANGLPANPKSVNGYFYASYHLDLNEVNSTKRFYGFAVCSDPARDLLTNYDHENDEIVKNGSTANIGNFGVGKITFSGNTLANSASSTSSDVSAVIAPATFDYGTNWITEGSVNFKPINVFIPRGFPLIANSSILNTISLSNDYVINVKDFITNYDSLTVRISSNPSNYALGIQKTIPASVSVVAFSSSDISNVLNLAGKAYIFFRTYNYSNKTVENKVYIFELSNKMEKQLIITP